MKYGRSKQTLSSSSIKKASKMFGCFNHDCSLFTVCDFAGFRVYSSLVGPEDAAALFQLEESVSLAKIFKNSSLVAFVGYVLIYVPLLSSGSLLSRLYL